MPPILAWESAMACSKIRDVAYARTSACVAEAPCAKAHGCALSGSVASMWQIESTPLSVIELELRATGYSPESDGLRKSDVP